MRKVIHLVTGIVIMAPVLFGFNAPKTEAASGKITASILNVRGTPSTKGKIIGKISRNSKVNYTNYSSTWVKIKYKNKTGYVSKKYIKAISVPTVNFNGKVTATILNVREKSQSNQKIIGKLSKGTIVKVTNKSNDWYYVTSGKIKGWVFSKYITKITGNTSSSPIIQNPVATSYNSLDIRYPSKVKAESINNYINNFEKYSGQSSVFDGKGQLFINIGMEAGINPLIIAAMAIHESNFGTNELSIKKYNLFSVGAYDSDPFYYAYTFQNVEHSIKYQVKFLKEQYLNPSSWKYKGPHLGGASDGLNYYYATDKQWGSKITTHANKIYPFNESEYTNVKLMTGVTPIVANPIIPEPKSK